MLAVTPEPNKTRPLLILWLLALPALLLVVSGGRRTFREQVQLPASGQEMLTTSFQLNRSWFGAPRVQVSVRQPIDTSSVINIALLDDKNDVVLSYYKDTWRQTGTWYEDGESGTWDEQDSEITTEFRPVSKGLFRLRLSLDDYLSIAEGGANSSSQTGVLPVVVEIYANTLNPGLLVTTSVLLLMGIGFYWWFEYAPKQRIRKVSRNESILTEAMLCSSQALIEVKWSARYEQPDEPVGQLPSAPVHCPLTLKVTDAWGTSLLDRRESLLLNAFQVEEDEQGFRGEQRLYLRLETSRRLSVRLEVPERLARGSIELERLALTLTELTQPLRPVTREEFV